MPPFKKTEINASLFPSAVRDGEAQGRGGTKGRETATTTPAGSTIVRTEDATAPPSNLTSRAPSLHDDEEVYGKKKVVLVEFDDDDPENPLNWPKSKKRMMTILLCSMTMMIGLSTSAYSSGINKMSNELGFSTLAGQAGLTAFNGACAILPLFIAPLCELSGRRWFYLGGFAAFTIVTFGLAFAHNLTTIIVCRILSGSTGSIGTILVGGTLNDMWHSSQISLPMSLFTFAAIFSTIFAPSYSGYIDQELGWRWIQYIHLTASGAVLLVEIFTLRESRGEAILRSRAKQLRKETGKEPVVIFLGLWIALAWGTAFLFLSVITITFVDVRGWSEESAGLPYLALAAGCFFGFAAGLLQDKAYDRNKAQNGGRGTPEARLYFPMVGEPLFPIGIMIYAWTGPFTWVHWIGPMVGLFCIIVGIYAIFLGVYSYTSDSYPAVASSAIAAQGLMRNMFGAVTPLFATQMFTGLGVQWAGLLLSLVAFSITPLPFILYTKGKTIRRKSKNASSDGEGGQAKRRHSNRSSSDEEQSLGQS